MNYHNEYRWIAVGLSVACVLLLLVWLTGCGVSNTTLAASARKPAEGHAVFADAKLQALWIEAQQAIATQPILLNAAYILEGREMVNVTKPADTQALSIWPDGVTVSTIPDMTVAELQAENPGVTLQHATDPTGVIHAPNGSSAKYCHSYTSGHEVVVAASMLYSGATSYEFQNVILGRLGYDLTKR